MSQHYRVDAAETLHARIHLVLSNSPFIRGRDVRFAVKDGTVILTGSVRSYYQKQMAQESLRGLEGLGAVCNDLAVVRG